MIAKSTILAKVTPAPSKPAPTAPRVHKKKSPLQVDIEAGARVRAARMLIGMSQDELGKAIGLTFQQVQKYEKGANRMGTSRLVQIAGVLQVPVGSLIPDPDAESVNNKQLEGAYALINRPGAIDLLRAYKAISDRTARTALLRVARCLAGQGATLDE